MSPTAPAKNPSYRISALARLGEAIGGRRIPVIRQQNRVDCGAASLAMVLAYHRKSVRLEEVREAVGLGRDGADARSIRDAAVLHGLRARGIKLEIDELPCLPMGSILHWEFAHFVVFESTEGEWVTIVDPAEGRRRIRLDAFRKLFTGVAIVLEPGDTFEPLAPGERAVWRYLKQVVKSRSALPRVAVLSLMLPFFALSVPLITSTVVDRVARRGDSRLLVVLSAGLAVLLGFHFLAALTRAHLLLEVRTLIDVRMTTTFLGHLTSLPFAFFQRRAAGDLMMRLNSNAIIRESLTGGVLSGVIDGTLATGYLLILFAICPLIATVVLALGGAQVLIFVVTRRRQRELMANDVHAQSRAQSYQVEMLAGFESLKAMGAERGVVEECTNLIVDGLNISLQRGRLNAVVDALVGTLRLGSPLMILVLGTTLVLRGELSLGTMLGCNALAVGFLGPLGSLVNTAIQFQLLGVYFDRLDDVLGTPPEQDATKVVAAPKLLGRVELKDVSFRYSPLSPEVLRNVSVHIEPGQFVAVVGPSGSGKSTLANLLVGLYVPTAGTIYLDGRDLSSLDARSVRQQFGVVMQHAYLFGKSVRENIALGQSGMALERVVAAAKLACIDDEIMAMPMGYDTILADGGTSISGGQRQRLALARAVAHAPCVLLLDEATSALDTVTEARVQGALDALPCTRIVIAHRLSTVVRADVILMVEDGRILERGTHAELLERRGAYHALVSSQLGNDARGRPPSRPYGAT